MVIGKRLHCVQERGHTVVGVGGNREARSAAHGVRRVLRQSVNLIRPQMLVQRMTDGGHALEDAQALRCLRCESKVAWCIGDGGGKQRGVVDHERLCEGSRLGLAGVERGEMLCGDVAFL